MDPFELEVSCYCVVRPSKRKSEEIVDNTKRFRKDYISDPEDYHWKKTNYPMSQNSTPRHAKRRPKNGVPKLEYLTESETSMAKNSCSVPRMPPLYQNGSSLSYESPKDPWLPNKLPSVVEFTGSRCSSRLTDYSAKTNKRPLSLSPTTEGVDLNALIRFSPKSLRASSSSTPSAEFGHLSARNSLSSAESRQSFYPPESVQSNTIVVKSNWNLEELGKTEKFDCEWIDCDKEFGEREELVRHIEKNHIDQRKGEDFTCFWKGCPRRQKPFNARYKLLIHMRTHSGEKPNKCTPNIHYVIDDTTLLYSTRLKYYKRSIPDQ
ncbi:DgyrCDS1610 [Dimorphilus gyrociliatus]|uniref:DgyrCDS1610 n=1 Tax=Dimorphilus gyrociliatus TaxID=2664684 RepID=A0A7I8V842_9ANNE|nr:DgyrCDS1610 [Dimorphilus gyrociliatus]